jgi:hypothetical protein
MNIFAIDQEDHSLVFTGDGEIQETLNVDTFLKFLDLLPSGPGLVIGDGNAWAVQNEYSVSQFGWKSQDDLDYFLAELNRRGYRAITIPNRLAKVLYHRYDMEQADAVLALWIHADKIVKMYGSFDSGHEVRGVRGDNSFLDPVASGKYGRDVFNREVVVRDFLRLQNTGGYDSPFGEDIVNIAWHALGKDERALFDLKKTMPKVNSLRRIAAVAVAVYDPRTGQLRTYKGRPWGTNFIVRRIIGLNGMMTGTGSRAPGNPMRAALRAVGRRWGDKCDAEERAQFDKLVRVLIKAFRAYGSVRPV